MWTWAQGAGFVNIEGKLTEELEQQGVDTTDQLPFVVTDPHFVYSYGETNTFNAFAPKSRHKSISPVLNSA
jgi:hypothetical protein